MNPFGVWMDGDLVYVREKRGENKGVSPGK
jgi:hypothetical protein